jgi:hypothetical protein
MSEHPSLRISALLLLFVSLAGTACQSASVSNFPSLHPRERALYTTVLLEPGGTRIQLASLTRQRIKQDFPAVAADGRPVVFEVELIGDREAESLYSGSILLRSSDGAWSSEHRLSPRSSGRWQFELDPQTNPMAWSSLRVEMEPDPYWEMDQQRPRSMNRRR